MSEKRLSINQWAEEDRPREKMTRWGAEALSDAELLAILIGSGNTDESAVALMRRILADCKNNLNELGKRSIEELCRFKGIGAAKAITLQAACELGKRRALQQPEERKRICSSRDIYALMHPRMCDLPVEESWILLLNQANRVIDSQRLSTGVITDTSVDIRLIVREAILKRATAIVLCHNHPSGNSRPSRFDDNLTDRLAQSCQIMNIKLIDHVIITDGEYYSYSDEGKI